MNTEEEAARRAQYRAQAEQAREDRAVRDVQLFVVEFHHDASWSKEEREAAEEALLSVARALKDKGFKVAAHRHSYTAGHQNVFPNPKDDNT